MEINHWLRKMSDFPDKAFDEWITQTPEDYFWHRGRTIRNK